MLTMEELLKEKGITQYELALRTELHPGSVNRIIHGHIRPSRRTKSAIARVLGVSVDEIQWPEIKKIG